MSQENVKHPLNGWFMLMVDIVLYLLTIAIFLAVARANGRPAENWPVVDAIVPWARVHPTGAVWLGVLLAIAAGLVSKGFLVLQPGQAAVLLLLGRYVGSVKTSGFFWVVPFYSRRKITLRLQNLNGERLKVNDKMGNPIEIAAVLVWRVQDTYAASFEVEDYASFVKIQSESALRHMSSVYPYDSMEAGDKEITLRGNVDEVSKTLERELGERLAKAGVEIVEARLSHLAYAQEIAEAMLRRQQATAIVAARQKIVEGAVGMVRMALEQLKEENVVDLDEERKATMVSNLLVVLCSEHAVQPMVNAGTLYQ
jgi:regulator of protease activity HflC (stomatin/prohibitin superfamily)